MKTLVLAITCGLTMLTPQRSNVPEGTASDQAHARIVKVQGTVRWRPNRQSPGVILGPDRRTLGAGESVLCEQDATLLVVVYGRELMIDASMGWYPIPFVPSRSAPSWWRRNYGERGGAQLNNDPEGKRRPPRM